MNTHYIQMNNSNIQASPPSHKLMWGDDKLACNNVETTEYQKPIDCCNNIKKKKKEVDVIVKTYKIYRIH